MNDDKLKNLEDDPRAAAGGSNPEELLLQRTSPSKSNQSDDAYEYATDGSNESNSGPANETTGDSVDRESVMLSDATRDESKLNDSSREMIQSENVSASLRSEPALKTQGGAGRGGKPRFKSRDRSIPVAVIQTDGLQVEIQRLIEELSGRFQNVAMDMTAKMDEMLRRIDDLERKLH